jgi:uncharacterized protein HemY
MWLVVQAELAQLELTDSKYLAASNRLNNAIERARQVVKFDDENLVSQKRLQELLAVVEKMKKEKNHD